MDDLSHKIKKIIAIENTYSDLFWTLTRNLFKIAFICEHLNAHTCIWINLQNNLGHRKGA